MLGYFMNNMNLTKKQKPHKSFDLRGFVTIFSPTGREKKRSEYLFCVNVFHASRLSTPYRVSSRLTTFFRINYTDVD
jgi:hypothetical protein